MNLEEHIYSVLILSSSEKFNSTFKDILPKREFDPVHIVSSVYQAQMRIAERQYDLIIINSPLCDESGVEFAIDSGSSNNTVTLLIVRNELYEDIYSKVVNNGIFVMQKPFSLQVVTQSVNDMKSARERLRRLEKKTVSLEDRMAEIRLVNRAKLILIANMNISEEEAHKYIEKNAMDNGKTKRQIAQEIINNDV